jgi:glutamate N-acetyltransferase/amino-acid N-acetyltransferase
MKFKIFPINGGLSAIEGVYCGATNCGLKKEGLDLGFIRFEEPAEVVYLLTTNRFKAAPLLHLLRTSPTKTNFLLANSKNANAMTGEAGIKAIEEVLEEAGRYLSLHNPIMSSTGVIGVPLPVEKLKEGLSRLDFNSRDSEGFARAIMTTDSFPKEMAVEVKSAEGSFKIAGVAKGAGMIAPAMATMLAFIVTDIALPRQELERALREVTEVTFNSISVDGDRSTNDSVFLFSTGRQSGSYAQFKEGLKRVMEKLALDIVRDGEGATKLVAFKVTGAKSNEEARLGAAALANSLLVKTALFGEDPNWGRIAATIGACGIECSEGSLTIKIGGVTLYRHGEILMTPEVEAKAHEAMKRDSFAVEVDLGVGDGSWTYYGCDLSYDYVKINAEYRT